MHLQQKSTFFKKIRFYITFSQQNGVNVINSRSAFPIYFYDTIGRGKCENIENVQQNDIFTF
jgi:hypothetical protein